MKHILQWTSARIGTKAAMEVRFSKILPHFSDKINFRIIKVAGTNGKGSVSAMLSACLVADGQQVGLFTSPHLINITERFRVNDVEITNEELEKISQEIFVWVKDFTSKNGEKFVPSFFEFLMLVAIEFFNRKNVKIAIFEAGVGGKNDATSLLPNIVGLITSIGNDHAAQLGNTLEAIAKDKAGIVQKDTTLIVQSDLIPHLQTVILDESHRQNVSCIFSKNYITKKDNQNLMIDLGEERLEVKPKLRGHFQRQNLNLVIETWLFLYKNQLVQRLDALKAIATTQWNARFEIIKGEPTFIIDAAHNEPALKALIQSLDEYDDFENRVLILGISKEKDLQKMSPLISQIAPEIYLTDDFYKSNTFDVLKNALVNLTILNKNAETIESLIQTIKKLHPKKTVVVTGSIFMIGKARKHLLNL